MKFDIASDAKNFIAGKPVKFPPFAPPTGPTGRRTIVEKYVLELTYDLDVTTAQINEENWWKLFANVSLNDAAGPRRNSSGPGLRHAHIEMVGAKEYQEGGDLGTGAGQTGTLRLDLPFQPDYSKDGRAYAIHADLMRTLHLTCAPSTALNLGTSVVTINSISIAVRAYCREESWGRVSFKSRDFIGETEMQSLTEQSVEVDGDEKLPLPFMLAYKADDQDTDMSGWTQHRVLPFMTEDVTREKQVYDYIADRDGVDYLEPVTAAVPKAVVIWRTGGKNPKQNDHPYVDKLTIKATNTVASAMVVYRTLQPRSEKWDRLVAKKHNVSKIRPKRHIPGGANANRFGELVGEAA